MTSLDLSRAIWRTSTRSGGNGNCVEIATNLPHIAAVRDSKHRDGPALVFTTADWDVFTAQVHAGALDLH